MSAQKPGVTMNDQRDVSKILDADFLAIRHAILDVAAGLDRLDRGLNSNSLAAEPRRQQLLLALEVLSEKEAGRTEQVQMVFSRPYDSRWRDRVATA